MSDRHMTRLNANATPFVPAKQFAANHERVTYLAMSGWFAKHRVDPAAVARALHACHAVHEVLGPVRYCNVTLQMLYNAYRLSPGRFSRQPYTPYCAIWHFFLSLKSVLDEKNDDRKTTVVTR